MSAHLFEAHRKGLPMKVSTGIALRLLLAPSAAAPSLDVGGDGFHR